MTLPITLLILRIISALLLLSFLFAVAWIAYKDLSFSAKIASSRNQDPGCLRIVSSTKNNHLENNVYPLRSVMHIGRAKNNTIVIDDSCISDNHCLVALSDGQVWLTDLNSQNGTKINNNSVEEPTKISWGDLIAVGETQIVFEQNVVTDELKV